jgi:hypothetical protein
MAVLTPPDLRVLPESATPVDRDGLLSRVSRPCADHGGEASCVGRDEGIGCLVFWCARGGHHFHTR